MNQEKSMASEVEALLALQEDDAKIAELENRMRSLEPRMAALDRKRESAAAAVHKSRAAL
jgi:hypothetical protein